MKRLLIAGAGGHGKVVAETALAMECWDEIAFLDDNPRADIIMQLPIVGKLCEAQSLQNIYDDLAVAIGNNVQRVEYLKKYALEGFNLPVIAHPTASISKFACVEPGTVIFAQSAINADAKIGMGCIINTGVTVDHDCVLADGVHLSPGVHLAGGVRVGKYSWLGIGSSVIQQVVIGENVIIGAGTVIIKSIESNVTAVGVPGRVIKKK